MPDENDSQKYQNHKSQLNRPIGVESLAGTQCVSLIAGLAAVRRHRLDANIRDALLAITRLSQSHLHVVADTTLCHFVKYKKVRPCASDNIWYNRL